MKPANVKMKSRLFHAVIAGGVALAVPIGLTACSSDAIETGANAAPDGAAATPGPGDDTKTGGGDSGGNGHEADASHGDSGNQDAAHADAHSDAGDGGLAHDADPDADGGWPPTK